MKSIKFSKMDGGTLTVGIVVSRWNADVTNGLLRGCKKALQESGVLKKNIKLLKVPGAFELPFAARHLIENSEVDVVITLGCLIKGETFHFEYVADAVAHGIMELNVDEDVPVIFGVLACLNEKQALDRSRGENNHGYWWGLSAVEMGRLKKMRNKTVK